MIKTFKITVSGQVQGVGFRPFVYTLAHKLELDGTVSNNAAGVLIYITGDNEQILTFYKTLITNPPPVSNIISHTISEVPSIQFDGFNIIPSQKDGEINLPLTADFAICEACKSDIDTADNRRANYPFTTCVNCGPRYALTTHFPFERSNTSIAATPMCVACQHEYDDPANRRFHSQTNSCGTCGFSFEIIDKKGKVIYTKKSSLFPQLAAWLKDGHIIALKNTSGYLLCCNAEDHEVVSRLRVLKNRPMKPFAVLYPSEDQLLNELKVTKKQLQTLRSVERPITLIQSSHYKGKISLETVAPKLNYLGVMFPYSGILHLLVKELDFPVVATSGNIHGSPILSENSEAYEKLNSIADYVVHHNLNIEHPQDDSVLKISAEFEKIILFRRSRGFAPNYLDGYMDSSEKILAMGAHLKSTISFFPNAYIYISQYLGNLDNYHVYDRFVKTIADFYDIFETTPTTIMVDAHPGYHSTRAGHEQAQLYSAKLIPVQHHEAHFTAILGEHQLFDQRVMGVVFDGTGYGTDKMIWGGEFFDYQSGVITRIDHVGYYNWLLGDKMAREPRLSLFSLASNDVISHISSKFSPQELKSYTTIKEQNKLKTSSIGRLFDAVASLLDLTDINSYEGEGAILLENLITDPIKNNLKSYLPEDSSNILPELIIQQIYKDLLIGTLKEQIAMNFLYTLARAIINKAQILNYEYVAFSGGVFQNTVLVDLLLRLVPKEIKLYFHEKLSPNDENISFGQLMYYNHITQANEVPK